MRLLPALVLVAALAGCGSGGSADRPSVVVVLVDQLRADAAEAWMPRTRALAEDGVVFGAMRAVAPWTYPSVISMFSGLYPQQHGADGAMNGRVMTTFARTVPLLPRLLRDAGYHTAGFVTNPFLHEWNPFHEAFDEYQADRFINSQGNLRGFGGHVWTDRMWADSVNPAVLEHYRGRPVTEPEFTYVHYIDVHGRRADAARWDGAPFPGTYPDACRYVDERIAELYDFFAARYDGDLVFVVTSDHGEDFGDDQQVGEGPQWRKKKATVHDFNLRIPCFVLPGKRVPAGAVVDQPCANLDLTPTLLDWAGLPVPPVLSGVSLLPAARGEAYDGHARPLYARMSAMGRHNDCVVHRGEKLLRHFDPQSGGVVARRVFDLVADPRETSSVADEFGARAALLEEAAGTHRIAFPATVEAPPDDVTAELRELGYFGEDG